MVVKIDDARIEVSLDVSQALGELREIESKLDTARQRRRRGGGEVVDPGRERRARGRRVVAVTGVTVTAARATAGRSGVATATGAGMAQAVGFATKLVAGLSLIEVIRQSPAIIPALLGEETMQGDLIPGLVTVQEAVESLGKKIAQIEGTLKTTVKAATLAYDLLQEGKLAEAGASGILEIRRAISPFPQDGRIDDKGVGGPLGFTEEVGAIFSAFRAYNTAEALFRQRTVSARFRGFLEAQQQGFRAAGGGVSK